MCQSKIGLTGEAKIKPPGAKDAANREIKFPWVDDPAVDDPEADKIDADTPDADN